MKVAAYQAPLSATGDAREIVPLVAEQVRRCESLGVEILCCPEGALGGLADYVDRPERMAFTADGPDLAATLAPLDSAMVTTILGYTERDPEGRLYNSAVIFHAGRITGQYRKLHPAIRKSVYEPGRDTPVFTIGGTTLGILICRDSTFEEPARMMAAKGATVLFIPTNNALPPSRGGSAIVAEARQCDIARARESGVAIVRADVAGRTPRLASDGSSSIVDRDGVVLATARAGEADLIYGDAHAGGGGSGGSFVSGSWRIKPGATT